MLLSSLKSGKFVLKSQIESFLRNHDGDGGYVPVIIFTKLAEPVYRTKFVSIAENTHPDTAISEDGRLWTLPESEEIIPVA